MESRFINRQKKTDKTIESLPTSPSKSTFWKGALVGFGLSALGSILTSYLQYHYSIEQKEVQLFIDEKKDFVSACEDYLTAYRNWHNLMQYYSAKDSIDTSFSGYSSATAKAAYFQWKDEIDASYGRMYLVSDNEFGAKTIFMSQGLTRALETFVFTDTLSVKQRYEQAAELDDFFFKHWLKEAKNEILNYNSGKRRQRKDDDYFNELRIIMNKQNKNDSYDADSSNDSDFNRAVFPDD